MNDSLPIILFHVFFFHKSYPELKKIYNHQLMAFHVTDKFIVDKMTLSLSYQKRMNDNIPIILFHVFFFHKSYQIINNKIWTLQNSKNQYNHQLMAFYGSEKFIVTKMTLSLCYKKLINDDLVIILFHLFFFHKSYQIINNKVGTLQNSKS